MIARGDVALTLGAVHSQSLKVVSLASSIFSWLYGVLFRNHDLSDAICPFSSMSEATRDGYASEYMRLQEECPRKGSILLASTLSRDVIFQARIPLSLDLPELCGEKIR